MNAVRDALYARLNGDATLLSMATGGVHHRTAPAETVEPFVIFQKQSAVREYVQASAGKYISMQDWLVKAVRPIDAALVERGGHGGEECTMIERCGGGPV